MKRFLIKINGKTYDAEVEVVGTSASAPVAAPAAAPRAAAPAAAAPAPKPQGMQPEILAAITAALSEEIGIPSRSMNIVNIKKI